jgi:hypothetical protein
MKLLVSSNTVAIPDGVTVEVKSRGVHVKGPRGELSRDFKHLAVDMFLCEEDGMKTLKVDCHFGKRKRLASLRTVCSHVKNMITGTFNSIPTRNSSAVVALSTFVPICLCLCRLPCIHTMQVTMWCGF